jgi:hypothetical protein
VFDLLFTALLARSDVSSLSPSPSPVPSAVARHLEYRFGWNTKVEDSGPLTGTLSVDIQPPEADGSVVVSATQDWWGSERPQETTTCSVFPSGGITCSQRPYILTGMELALFPMLGKDFFSGFNTTASSQWEARFALTRGIGVWNADFTLDGRGPIAGSAPLQLIELSGSLKPDPQHYSERSDQITGRVAYDPNAKLPVMVSEQILHQTGSTRNLESVQLRLTKSGT